MQMQVSCRSVVCRFALPSADAVSFKRIHGTSTWTLLAAAPFGVQLTEHVPDCQCTSYANVLECSCTAILPNAQMWRLRRLGTESNQPFGCHSRAMGLVPRSVCAVSFSHVSSGVRGTCLSIPSLWARCATPLRLKGAATAASVHHSPDVCAHMGRRP